ncbi:MAG: GNAT family N-acetyltransferase, partial [Pseudomonadota bacterium]
MPAKVRLVVRVAEASDVDAIVGLDRRVYPNQAPYSPAQILGQIRNFPEGQFVVVDDGVIAGYCATFQIDEAIAFAPHSWNEITGGGYAARHDPSGDWLYGMEIFIDPALRGRRLGQRLYKARRDLCARLNLKGVVFAGRMPGLARKKKMAVEDYAAGVVDQTLRDPVLSFQLRNGFEFKGLLPNYDPTDRDSRGYAAHLIWRNPKYIPPVETAPQPIARAPDVVRIAVVQYQQRQIASFDAFGKNVEYFVDVVADYRADFVLFPE